jgi:hypothetical protein
VGRMDVPEMRLQGRQVWARAGCTLRRHARVPEVGAVAPSLFQPLPIFACIPMRRCSRLPSRGTHNDESSGHECERSAPARQEPTGSLRPQTSCLCNQLEFLRHPGGCYLLWLGRRMRLP